MFDRVDVDRQKAVIAAACLFYDDERHNFTIE